jgi:MFS family permease
MRAPAASDDRSRLVLPLLGWLIAGWGVGAPIFGWLSDRIGRRKAPLVVGLMLQSAALAALVYIPGLPIAAVATLCFLVGFLGATQILCLR